jgi:predicted dehydrogenase
MNKSKLGICVIGSGRAGRIHMNNFAFRIPSAKLVAVVDPVETAAVSAAKDFDAPRHFLDYKDALDDDAVDAVVVVTPTVFHRDIVVAAAKAGKHILCEKPMAMNVAECEDMIAATNEHKVKLQIGFMRRFDANFRAAKAQIESGVIGDIVLVKSLTHGPSIPQRWMYDIDKSNGPLAEVSSHDIDTVRWFTGSEFKHLYAIGGNYRCQDVREEFPDFYDNVIVTGNFENGMQGFVGGAVSVRYGYDSRAEILGTKGIIHVGTMKENSVITTALGKDVVTSAVESWQTLFTEAYYGEDLAFVNAIIEDTSPPVTGIDGLMAVKVVNAGNLSIKEKRPVTL